VGSFGFLLEESSALVCIDYLGWRLPMCTTSAIVVPTNIHPGFFFRVFFCRSRRGCAVQFYASPVRQCGRLLPLCSVYICWRSDSPLPCKHCLAYRFPSGSVFFVIGGNERTCLFFVGSLLLGAGRFFAIHMDARAEGVLSPIMVGWKRSALFGWVFFGLKFGFFFLFGTGRV
jgi:hypothetical protein